MKERRGAALRKLGFGENDIYARRNGIPCLEFMRFARETGNGTMIIEFDRLRKQYYCIVSRANGRDTEIDTEVQLSDDEQKAIAEMCRELGWEDGQNVDQGK